jgi:diguanylate cyclase (GGDEF)-like protein
MYGVWNDVPMDGGFTGGVQPVRFVRAWRGAFASNLNESLQWRLAETIYRQRATHVAAFLAVAIVGGSVWGRTHSPWVLGWTVAAAVLLLVRIGDFVAYHRRRAGDDPQVWIRRFVAGTWLQAGLWGIGGAATILFGDAHIQLIVVAVQSGFLAAGASRNNAVPAAAGGQIVLTLVPMLVACVLSGDPYFLVFSLLVLLNFLVTLTIVRNLHRQTVGLLITEQRNDALLRSLGTANAELAEANRRLEVLATTDGLTGVANRRGFDLALRAEWQRATRAGHGLALLFVDIDLFKAFNDTFGHPAGDDCLRRIAACIAAMIRHPTDIVARYGGEEFAIILSGTSHAGAAELAERLRVQVQALALHHPHSQTGVVTVSVGVAAMSPALLPVAVPDDLVAQADRELYRAKASGRNRVRCAA